LSIGGYNIGDMPEGLGSRSDTRRGEAELHLDPKTVALVSLAAAVSLDAETTTYRTIVAQARENGATDGELLGVFLAVAPIVGTVTLVRAAPRLSLALGYDVDLALETE
jgi:4-carboxymuconolactone decarboxylase